MRRVMIVGQPGSGKSTLARRLGTVTKLPVFHMDHINWMPGWVERDGAEKDRLCAEVHARERWIFEGGRSSTWPARLERADTLIWLDMPVILRLRRVSWRSLRYLGRTRPDLPARCPDYPSAEFLSYVWRTRYTGRAKLSTLYERVPVWKAAYRLTSPRAVERFLSDLTHAAARGNLGIPHR